MKVGDMVMLIGREPDMPPCGVVGTIVGPLDRGDFDVVFPGHPCEAGEPSWLVPPVWLMVIPPPEPAQREERFFIITAEVIA